MTAGIEIADGRIRALSVDVQGRVVSRSEASRPSSDLAGAVCDAVRALRAAGAPPLAAGIALPFQEDELPRDVASAVARETGVVTPVAPGAALVLAETWCGAAQGGRHVVCFSIGEHVVAGSLADGQPLTGARGRAGSVAWLALNPVERDDYRRHGGLEAEVSASGIVRRLVWRIKSGDRSRVEDYVGGDLSRLTADDVFAAARAGDGVCISVVRDTARYVGMAVANLASVLDPECVVLGGALAEYGDLMLEAVRAECARRVRPAQADELRLMLSTLGPDAVAIGAARAAMLARP
jgi:glucokinase